MPRPEKRTSLTTAPRKGRSKAAPEAPASDAAAPEPAAAEPAAPEVIVEDDGDLPDDELGALPPPEDDDEGDVVDVAGTGLVKRSAIALPEGEWVRDEGPAVVDDGDEVPATRGDDLYNRFVRQATK